MLDQEDIVCNRMRVSWYCTRNTLVSLWSRDLVASLSYLKIEIMMKFYQNLQASKLELYWEHVQSIGSFKAYNLQYWPLTEYRRLWKSTLDSWEFLTLQGSSWTLHISNNYVLYFNYTRQQQYMALLNGACGNQCQWLSLWNIDGRCPNRTFWSNQSEKHTLCTF